MLKKNGKIIAFIIISIALLAFIALRNSLPLSNNSSEDTSPKVVAYGLNTYGQLGATDEPSDFETSVLTVDLPGNVKQLAAGDKHSIALLEDGTVWGWGNNRFGQVGVGSEEIYVLKPTRIEELDNIVQISAKLNHSTALDSEGNVWTWGSNLNGQIGNGNNDNQNRPYMVTGLPKIQKIGNGYRFALALDETGSIWAWGGSCNEENINMINTIVSRSATPLAVGGYHDPYGSDFDEREAISDCTNENSVGILSKSPIKIAGFENIVDMDGGYGHIVALDNDGRVWTDGCNQFGQLGIGVRGNPGSREPNMIDEVSNVKSIAAGFRQTTVIDQNDDVWGWGYVPTEFPEGERHITFDMYDAVSNPDPTKITKLSGITKMIGAHDYAMFLMDSGDVYTFGDMFSITNKENFLVKDEPRIFTAITSDLKDISTSRKHILAITAN